MDSSYMFTVAIMSASQKPKTELQTFWAQLFKTNDIVS